MIENLKAWFKHRFSAAESTPPPSLMNAGGYRQRLVAKDRPSSPVEAKTEPSPAADDPPVHGSIESLGPGKNVYVQNPYVREELGTHESLKIVDGSLVDGEEPDGMDPYNTGRFDKSKKWDQRFRK
jgi:hypothetical protein